jgi:hypothetical protein
VATTRNATTVAARSIEAFMYIPSFSSHPTRSQAECSSF